MREYSTFCFFIFVASLVGVFGGGLKNDVYIAQTVEGKFCKIPFVFKGKTYHDCTMEGSDKPWCYIDQPGSKWGTCKPHPPEFVGCQLATPNITNEEAEIIVNEHNKVRARMNAVRMRKLVWNSELAEKAQAAANKCQAIHLESLLCGGRYLTGQNLYVTYHKPTYPDDLPWSKVVGFWSGEEKNFDINTLNCADGKLCGHFTQVVWDKTGFIGCGKSYCHGELWNRTGRTYHSIQYYCNYHYTGNYDGEAPYKVSDKMECKECYNIGMEQPGQRFRCDKDKLCEACWNDQEGCVSTEDIKKEVASGQKCVDTSPLCEINKGMCKDYHDGNLPVFLHQYVFECKVTCGLC